MIVLIHVAVVKWCDEELGGVRACATFAMKAAAMMGGKFGELQLHLCKPKQDLADVFVYGRCDCQR